MEFSPDVVYGPLTTYIVVLVFYFKSDNGNYSGENRVKTLSPELINLDCDIYGELYIWRIIYCWNSFWIDGYNTPEKMKWASYSDNLINVLEDKIKFILSPWTNSLGYLIFLFLTYSNMYENSFLPK